MAYTRVRDSYRDEHAVPDAARRLIAWAEARGHADRQWLGYMWDDPEIVALEQCRYDVAVEVDHHHQAAGEIGRFEFPEMQVAQVKVSGSIEIEMQVLEWLFATWLPRSRCVPGDNPCFEAWIGRPFAHGMSHFELLVQVPIVPE